MRGNERTFWAYLVTWIPRVRDFVGSSLCNSVDEGISIFSHPPIGRKTDPVIVLFPSFEGFSCRMGQVGTYFHVQEKICEFPSHICIITKCKSQRNPWLFPRLKESAVLSNMPLLKFKWEFTRFFFLSSESSQGIIEQGIKILISNENSLGFIG